jgi:hypothetical protein
MHLLIKVKKLAVLLKPPIYKTMIPNNRDGTRLSTWRKYLVFDGLLRLLVFESSLPAIHVYDAGRRYTVMPVAAKQKRNLIKGDQTGKRSQKDAAGRKWHTIANDAGFGDELAKGLPEKSFGQKTIQKVSHYSKQLHPNHGLVQTW